MEQDLHAVFAMFYVNRFFLTLVLAGLTNFAQASDGANHGGGGNGDRKRLEDLATQAFDTLKKIESFHSLVTRDGTIISARSLSEALNRALLAHDVIIFDSLSDEDCPLKDDTNSCVEFLSQPDTMQLSVDLGRVRRGFTRNHINTNENEDLNKRAEDNYLTQQMIHEAFRMARQPDVSYQYSHHLALIVDQYRHNAGHIDFLLASPDPQWKSTSSGPLNIQDFLNAKFYFIEYQRAVYFTFFRRGTNLFAAEMNADGSAYSNSSMDCGNLHKIVPTRSFRCTDAMTGDFIDVTAHKPRAAPMFLDLYLGPSVGPRDGWVKLP